MNDKCNKCKDSIEKGKRNFLTNYKNSVVYMLCNKCYDEFRVFVNDGFKLEPAVEPKAEAGESKPTYMQQLIKQYPLVPGDGIGIWAKRCRKACDHINRLTKDLAATQSRFETMSELSTDRGVGIDRLDEENEQLHNTLLRLLGTKRRVDDAVNKTKEAKCEG